MISGVKIKKLEIRPDDRGFLLEVLKSGDEIFREVKQINYTETYPGVIKAFHYHKKQWDIWFVVSGAAQVVLYDLREDSPTRGETDVFYPGGQNREAILIPPGVAHGYRVLGAEPVKLIYCVSEVYDKGNPDELRMPFDDSKIGFNWETKNR